MAVAAIEMLKIPGDLLLEFFVTFSRFEYALKRAGYLKPDRMGRPYAAPHWDRFAAEMSHLGEPVLGSIFHCCPYLQFHPPNMQVVEDGRLTWQKLPSANSVIAATLLSVKTVRNNLFHGGNFQMGRYQSPRAMRS